MSRIRWQHMRKPERFTKNNLWPPPAKWRARPPSSHLTTTTVPAPTAITVTGRQCRGQATDEFRISIPICSPETWFCDFCREKFRNLSQNMFIVKFQNRTNLFAVNNLKFVIWDSLLRSKQKVKLFFLFLFKIRMNCENSIFIGTEWVNHCCHICKHFSKSWKSSSNSEPKFCSHIQTSKSSIFIERHTLFLHKYDLNLLLKRQQGMLLFVLR